MTYKSLNIRQLNEETKIKIKNYLLLKDLFIVFPLRCCSPYRSAMDPVALESALEKKCKNHVWLAWTFFLASAAGIFRSMHVASYVFLGGNLSFFCNVPELREANWTIEQIKTISSPWIEKESCTVYAWNYTLLKEMGFDEAVKYKNITQKPDVINCKSYIYDEETPHQTIVSQWDLVCDNAPLRRAALVGVAFGKFVGAFMCGLLADRFGRKKVFVLSCLLFIAVCLYSAFTNNYIIFIILRIVIGLTCSGTYEAGYTILAEITVKNYRPYITCMYSMPFSLGFIFLALAAYFTQNWRQLQLAISLPAVFLLITCWYLPESPRWLITRGKVQKASDIFGSEYRLVSDYTPSEDVHKDQPFQCYKKVIIFFKSYFKLFSTLELTKRTLVCYFGWFATNLNYFAIIMNGVNFTVNEYVYVALNGIVETPSYLLPPLILMYFGRKSTGMALFTLSGFGILSILVVPQGWPVMCMAMIGRVSIAMMFAVIALHTSELIPTEYRNTAIGSSIGMGQLGSMAAPYIIDTLGKKAWWIPSTLGAFLSLIAALLWLLLPETRDTLMVDTLKEMHQQEELNLSKAIEKSN